MTVLICPNCGGTLEFEADYGAPGIGSSYRCATCKEYWAVIGKHIYDPADMAHIMTEEDVI